MLLPDVSVCVHAIAPHTSEEAGRVRDWLDRVLVGHETVGFSELVLSAMVRPGSRPWQLFSGLVTTRRLRGNDVPDAYLAGIAMEAGAHLATLDRGFRRFDGLRTVNPLDGSAGRHRARARPAFRSRG